MARKKLPGEEKGMSLERKILDEVVGKAEDYEASMTGFMAEVGEWAGLYKAVRPARKRGAFSNPRSTEFYRASTALSTLMFRMMTSADPYFSCNAVDMGTSYDDLTTLLHVFKTQLKYSKYKQNLLRACNFMVPFGTVIAQEDYRIVGVSPFGRRVPVTTFTPRVLDQVFFDRGTIDIDEADWISTSDVTSNAALKRLAEEDDDLKTPWNKEALLEAAEMKENSNTMNPRVLQRLTRNGSFSDDAFLAKKEMLMYYGKLDSLNDGVEYVCALVNRKIMVRFHANRFQHGKRQFRIAKFVDFDSALGIGLGQLAPLHRSMDANMQKIQDSIAFATYSPWKRRKNTVDDEDLEIRPMQIINVDDPSDLTPLDVPTRGAEMGLKLDEILKQEFRNASGATDTLQAILTEATTASAVTLAQNEGMRRISVGTEIAAESLVREHLEVMHWNNVQNIKAPFNINRAGVATRVYPDQLKVDLEFETKVTTDKDFRPQRLEKLINLIQILTSTKSQHPDQMSISILPLVKQVAYMLDVNPEDVIQGPTQQPIMGAPELSGLGGLSVPSAPGGPAELASVPGGDVFVSPS